MTRYLPNIILIVAVILISFLLINIDEQYHKESQWVEHTYIVKEETNILLSALKDAETGQRGYLLTKDDSYLEPYFSGIQKAKESLKKLKELTSDNINQQKKLEEVADLIKLKFDELKLTIDLTDSNEHKKALIIVKQDIGKEYMDVINAFLSNFIEQEEQLLVQRKQNLEELELRIKLTILMIIVITLIGIKYFLHQLQNEKRKFESLLENASDGLHVFDTKGNIYLCNDVFANNLGYTKEEAQKLNLTDWNKTYQPNEIKEIIQNRIKTPSSFDTKHTKKDGTQIDVHISAKGIKINGKDYLYASQRDITEAKQKDKFIEEQSKMAALGEMMGNVAHQWRQPLNVISTKATGALIQKDMGLLDDTKIEECMESINEHAQYLSKTIDTFKNFIRSSNQKEQISTTIQNELDMAFQIEEATLKSYYISIDTNICEEELPVTLPEGELSQVIINIMNNAKDILLEKNQEENRWIKLDLYKEDSTAIITIEDNAGGIPKDVLPKIFEPYFTTKHQSQGTGLGLHMSYQIITESLQGNLYAKNTENGAKFYIELPITIES